MGRPVKYTLKYCLNEIKGFARLLKADEKGRFITWHDLVKDKPYSRQRISEWRKEFAKQPIFSDTIKKLEEELENRLYKLGLANKANATLVIFGLKNNYGWNDRQELTGKDGKDLIPAQTLTKEQAKELWNNLENGKIPV
jgi:hypothetical protein